MNDEEVLRAQLLAWTDLSPEQREAALRLYTETTKRHGIVRHHRRRVRDQGAVHTVRPSPRA